MLLSVRTIYGAELLSAQAVNLELGMAPFTTMNEALLQPSIVPFPPSNTNMGMYAPVPYNYATDTQSLRWQYVCIGMGGHMAAIDQPTGVSYNQPVIHLATDACLYKPLPWYVGPVTNVANTVALMNAGYRLRKTMTINGVLHEAFYARVMQIQTSTVTPTLTTVTNGVSDPQPFSPTINNLLPVPPAVGTNTAGQFAGATVSVSIPFTNDDFTKIQNACQLLYGNPNLAQVSEVAICSGMDKSIQYAYSNTDGSQLSSVPAGVIEAVAVQCNAFITFPPITAANSSGALEFDLGCVEPLYGAEQ